MHAFFGGGVCDADDLRETRKLRKLTFRLSSHELLLAALGCCKVLKQRAWSKRTSRLKLKKTSEDTMFKRLLAD